MKAAGEQLLVPQQEEQITEINWLPPAQWESIKQNSFPSILDVLDKLNP
jgi:hypothetical protein